MSLKNIVWKNSTITTFISLPLHPNRIQDTPSFNYNGSHSAKVILPSRKSVYGTLAALTPLIDIKPYYQSRFYSSPVNKVTNKHSVYHVPEEQSVYKRQNTDVEYKDKNFAYFVIGATGVMGAITARNLVLGYLEHFSASADVLASGKVEVSMSSIPEGKNAVIKWRGKPIFIRHRTDDEIDEANGVDLNVLKDPEPDSVRTKDPKWLVMIGVCTHLGCIPVGESGDFGGWFCPCHGSHYDISGRIRKGPAPLNLEIPQYNIVENEEKIVIG